MVTKFEKPMGTEIGNLASLSTTDKSSVVGAINSLNSKMATKYFTSVNDMVTTLNALSENEQIRFVCNATVSTSLTGINSMASGVFTKVSSTYADAIWVTNGGSDSGTSRINISTSNFVVNNLNSNLENYTFADGTLKSLDGVDIRTINKSGRYYCKANCTNLPVNSSGYLDVYYVNSTVIHHTFRPTNNNNVYETNLYGSSWSEWSLH